MPIVWMLVGLNLIMLAACWLKRRSMPRPVERLPALYIGKDGSIWSEDEAGQPIRLGCVDAAQ